MRLVLRCVCGLMHGLVHLYICSNIHFLLPAWKLLVWNTTWLRVFSFTFYSCMAHYRCFFCSKFSHLLTACMCIPVFISHFCSFPFSFLNPMDVNGFGTFPLFIGHFTHHGHRGALCLIWGSCWPPLCPPPLWKSQCGWLQSLHGGR